MPAQPVHTTIINATAREVLRPLGLAQKERSRFWYDDGGWYVIGVEFQPSGWSKGTYLNVGVHWLWYPKNHFSFDLGHRKGDFVEFGNEQEFQEKSRSFAQLAAETVKEYRGHLRSIANARNYVSGQTDQSEWSALHLGVLTALNGEVGESRGLLEKAIVTDADWEWALDRNAYLRSVLALLEDRDAVRGSLEAQISKSRSLQNLKDVPPPRLPPG